MINNKDTPGFSNCIAYLHFPFFFPAFLNILLHADHGYGG